MRKNPIHRNTPFQCENCKKWNPKAQKTCRNHCKFCLYGKHVDEATPGDRASTCQGLMEPFEVLYQGKKGHQILHRCQKCDKKIPNIAASDDDLDALIDVMQKQNILQPMVRGKKAKSHS